MRKVMSWLMAAAMMGATALFIACSNSDNYVNPRSTAKKQPKIWKIYKSGTSVVKSNLMGNWMTIIDKVEDRVLEDEFFWTGDRLDSVKTGIDQATWYMEYDADGRLVHKYNHLGSIDYTFEYDSQNRLSKTIRYIRAEDENFNKHIIDYTYDGDKLTKSVIVKHIYGYEGTLTEVNDFTWKGDNVVGLSTLLIDAEGHVTDSQDLIAEYSTYQNPFRNMIHFATKDVVLTVNDEMWAYSKNMPKRIIAGPGSVNEYNCKTVGSLLTSFHTFHKIEAETVLAEDVSDYDFEYIDE